MPKAIWNGTVLAESDRTEVVENNHYFPADAINREYFKDSNTHTTCPWKGVASYYNIEVDGQVNKMLPGIILPPRTRLKILRAMSHFGRG
jgi:uncharacterized protein (DUF427 family)